MNNVLNTILTNTYSLTQLKHRLNILKSYLLKAFFGNLEQIPLSREDLTWLSSLPEQFYQQFNKDNVYSIFDQLEELSGKLTLLIIYLPFDPDDNTLGLITAFARRSFGNPFLIVDNKLDPKLIAGCALSWRGVLKDYSLRFRIEEKKEEIMQQFKKFLR